MTGQLRPDELIRILRAEFVTRPGGVPGGLCVTFTCGATGWRATGGTIPRTLVHEVAFQLDTGGNARGAYAVDLQQDRNVVAEVAAGDYSFMHGQDNIIGIGADFCIAMGWDNELHADAWMCGLTGGWNTFNAAAGGHYLVYAFGENHDIDECNYGFFAGAQTTVNGLAFGVYSLGEANTFTGAGADFPTYSFITGTGNLMNGDMWFCHQFGEDNTMERLGTGTTMWSAQIGFNNYMSDVQANLIVGEEANSFDRDDGHFYDGRFVLNNGVNKWLNLPPWVALNQGSIFSQEELITTWNVAWTTSFQFPIFTDMVWYFKVTIVGTEGGAANSYCWILEGFIENDGGVTTLLNSTATINYYRDVVTKEWQVLADNVNDRLIFQFRDTAGPDATDCNIQMQMFTTEVGYV